MIGGIFVIAKVVMITRTQWQKVMGVHLFLKFGVIRKQKQQLYPNKRYQPDPQQRHVFKQVVIAMMNRMDAYATRINTLPKPLIKVIVFAVV